MRVLEIVHGFPPGAEGGTELYAEAHAAALAAQGDDVLVLTRDRDASRPEYEVRTESRPGLRVVAVNNTFRQTSRFEETYRNDAIEAAAAVAIRDFAPAVAHIHHLTGLSTTLVDLLRREGVPIVCTLHDYWLMCHRGQLLDVNYRRCDGPSAVGDSGCQACVGTAGGAGRALFAGAAVVRAMERTLPVPAARSLRRAAEGVAALGWSGRTAADQERGRIAHMRGLCAGISRFLAPSRHMRDAFVRFGVPPEKILHAPLGIAGPPPAGERLRPRDGIEAGARQPLRIGFLGAITFAKGPHVLVEAAARLPPGSVAVDIYGAHADYHGDRSYRRAIEGLVATGCARLRGQVPHEDVGAVLGSTDVLAVPSLWPENSPLVVHEAFRAGVPVLASRIGGLPELVTAETDGLLFEPGDAGDLARQIRRLLDEPGLLGRLRAGVPPVRANEEDVTAARRLYRELV